MLPQTESTGARVSEATDAHTSAATEAPRQCKRKSTFQSDLPQLMSLDHLPNTACWRDIELFLLRNPEGGRDVLCAIIEFRSLKGRPEGADG